LEALKFFIKSSKVIFKIAIVLAVIAGLAFSGIYLFFKIVNDQVYSESKFDSDKWIEAGKRHPVRDLHDFYTCARGKMYNDLKKNYLKKGMSFEEVKKLLGEPSGKRIYSNYLYIYEEWLNTDNRTIEEYSIHVKQYLDNNKNRNKILSILDHQRKYVIYKMGGCNMASGENLLMYFDEKNILKKYYRNHSNDYGFPITIGGEYDK
jgi:outer membrane protein assembly factor BamE (lipoprotein component of BamABCDE complex)